MAFTYPRVVFAFCWSLLYTSAYLAQGVNISVRGIGLANLLEANPKNLAEEVEIDKKAQYIHTMLKEYPWPEASFDTTEVEILDMDTSYSDTDDSVSSKLASNNQKRFYQRTKNLKANNRKGGTQFDRLEETYVKPGDIDLENDNPAETTKIIGNYLSERATKIVWEAGSEKAANQTTCLCVMLRDKYKRVKQLVFHNLKNYLPSAMHNTAVEMGIGMRGNEQMHAEASFLGFLLHRAEKKEHAYTHVLGMGCSKNHCQECDALLKLFLGSNYHVVTSAAVKSSQEKSDFTVEHPPKSGSKVHFEMKYAKDAIRTKENPSNKFRLSDNLQEHIKLRYGLSFLPIDKGRFCNEKSSGMNQETKPPATKRPKNEA
jgi:hypothetical protein